MSHKHREIICIVGPTASGKSIRSKIMAQAAGNCPVLSVGEKVRQYYGEARLAPLADSYAPQLANAFVEQLVDDFLQRNIDKPTVILEGYPRTEEQVNLLIEKKDRYSYSCFVVYLNGADPDTQRARIFSRGRASADKMALDIAKAAKEKPNMEKLLHALQKARDSKSLWLHIDPLADGSNPGLVPGVICADVLAIGDLREPRKFGDAGLDLEVGKDVVVGACSFATIPSDIRVKIDDRCFGMVLPRSSTNFHKGIICLPSVIDCGYIGYLSARVYNPTPLDIFVEKGSRIAQLVVIPRVNYSILRVDSLPDTDRGTDGFGSTGA